MNEQTGIKTILLVEDDPIIALSERRVLERNGYRVTTAATGGEAVETSLGTSEIDLILMDINLGAGIDGTEAAALILEKRDLPLIFLSAHTEPEIVEKTEGITSYGYIVKNSGTTVLLAAIRMAFRLHEARMAERAARKRLEHTYHMMRYVIEHVRSAIAIHDRDLNYLYVSRKYLESYHVEEDDIIGRHHYEIFPDLPERWREVHRKALAGVASSAENDLFVRADGNRYWTRWECLPWYDEDGEIGGIIINTEVINDQREIERRLAENEIRFKTFTDSLQDVVFTIDGTMRHTAVYGPWVRNYGLNHDFFLGKNFEEILGAEAAEIHNRACARALAGEFTIYEWSAEMSGRTHYFQTSLSPLREPDGIISGVVGIGRDITELILARKTLEISEARFHNLIENAEAVAIQGYDAGGVIRYWNKAAERLYGYTEEEAVGRSVIDLVIPSDIQDEARTNILTMTTTHTPMPPQELILQRKDGSQIPVFSSHTLLSTRDGDTEVFCIAIDLTTAKEAERHIHALLREKELILREAHHRIKNNMASVSGILAVEAETHTDPTVRGILQDASRRVQSMMVLYDRLYRAENTSEMNLRDFLPSLTGEILGSFAPLRSPAVRTVVDAEDIVLETKILSTIGIILNELISNSMKYAFAGSSDPYIRISAQRPNGTIRLVYEDNGSGLAEGIDTETSSGFGLHLVGMLVGQLQGRLNIVRGKGVRFEIEFEG